MDCLVISESYVLFINPILQCKPSHTQKAGLVSDLSVL